MMIKQNYQRSTRTRYFPKVLQNNHFQYYLNSEQLFTGTPEGLEFDLYEGANEIEQDIANLVADYIKGGFRMYTNSLKISGTNLHKPHQIALMDRRGESGHATYASKSYDSSEATSVNSIDFNQEGTKMFMCGQGDTIYQYTLSTAWDISTASYDSISKDLSSISSTLSQSQWSEDGMSLFLRDGNNIIYRVRTNKAYSIQGLSDDQHQSYDVSGFEELSTSWGFQVCKNGHRLIVSSRSNGLSSDGVIVQFNLSTANDLDTISYSSSQQMKKWFSGVSNIADFKLNKQGTKAYLADRENNQVTEFDLKIPYEIREMERSGNDIDVSSEITLVGFITISPDGTQVYAKGIDAVDTNDFYQYSVSAGERSGGDISTAADLSSSKDVSVQGGVEALCFDWFGDHLYFGNGNEVRQLNCSTRYDVAGSTVDSNITINTNTDASETAIVSMKMRPDGKRFYVVGTAQNAILEYIVYDPWDLESAVFNKTYDISKSGEGNVAGIAFSNDGRTLIVGYQTNELIQEWILTDPWNLTTLKEGSNSFTGSSTDLQDLAFSRKGDYLYESDQDTDKVFGHALSSAFDISTKGSTPDEFDFTSKDAELRSFDVKPDGTKAVIAGQINQTIFEYSMTASYTEKVLAVSNCFKILEESDADFDNYSHVEYWSDEDVFDFGYESTGVRNEIYLDLSLLDAAPEANIEQYQEISSGEIRNLNAQANLVHLVETMRFDKEAHRAFSMLVLHRFKIDGKEYTPKGSYTANLNKKFALTNGEIELYDVKYGQLGTFH